MSEDEIQTEVSTPGGTDVSETTPVPSEPEQPAEDTGGDE